MRILKTVLLVSISLHLMSCVDMMYVPRSSPPTYREDEAPRRPPRPIKPSIPSEPERPRRPAAPPPRPREQPLPYGNYQESCSSCSIREKELSCYCKNDRGMNQYTVLDTFGCDKRITNQNGVLTCGERRVEPLPQGSYQQSCRQCNVVNDTLTCSCPSEAGTSWQSSLSLRSCNRPITNQNGVLTCGERREEPLPQGSYQQSCRQCTVTNDTLTCSCSSEAGTYWQSSLSLRSCNRPITNQNGVLTCGARREEPLPQGSYQQSCRQCNVTNDTLTCSCSSEAGTYWQSSLSLRGCNRPISNQNGVLTCGDGHRGPTRFDPNNPVMRNCVESNVFGRYPRGGGCNTFGCYPEGAGCNTFGCYLPGGGCNTFGCYEQGGGCNTFGCYPPGGSCNTFGCSRSGSCNTFSCPDPVDSRKGRSIDYSCE